MAPPEHRPSVRPPLTSTRLREIARDAYLVLAALASLALLMNALPGLHRTLSTVSPPDLVADYKVATAYRDGYDPYSPAGARRSTLNRHGDTGFGHPPTTAFWALPLTRFDLVTANIVLGWLTLLMLLLELCALALALRCPAPLSTAFLGFSYLLTCSFVTYHLSAGQWSEAIGFLICAAWLSLRRGRDALAGLCLGAACTMKLFPGVVVVFLLVARRFRAAAWAGAAYLAVAAVMTARFGFASWKVFLAVQGRIADQWLDNIQNQSVHGIVARLFFPTCGPRAGHVIPAATALSTGISLAIAAALAWALRSRQRVALAFDLGYGAFVLLSLFTSQWTWEHYDVIFVLPMAILMAQLPWLWQRARRRWAAAIVAVEAGTLASWALSVHEKIGLQPVVRGGDHAHHLRLHALEIVNWLPLVLLLALLVRILYLRVEPIPARPSAGSATGQPRDERGQEPR